MNGSLFRSTMLLTLSMAISKILGFIYVIPFTILVGVQGNILFEYAYKPYSILLSIGTMGIPVAVSRFVSKYNELGDYRTGQRLLNSGILFTLISGFLSFAALYGFAPSLANHLIDANDSSGNKIEDVIYVIHMVSFALLIVPVMSVIRGFFQGYQSMGPTAISQVIEQIVRIIFILVSAFIIIMIVDGSIVQAVGYATFGATVGAIASFAVLIAVYFKRRKGIQELIQNQTVQEKPSLLAIYKELFRYAIPYVLLSLAIPLYQLIETFTLNGSLIGVGYSQVQAETANSVIALVQKLILIPVSLATAFGFTLIPSITQSFTSKDMVSIRQKTAQTYEVLFLVLLPIVGMMMILGHSLFGVMFGFQEPLLGGKIMMYYAPAAFFYSFFIVTTSILQGMNRDRIAMISLTVGILLKLGLNGIFIEWFHESGTILTTYIGFTASLLINMWGIQKHAELKTLSLVKNSFSLFIITCLMVGVVAIEKILYEFFIPFQNTYFYHIPLILIGGLSGVLVYGYFTLRTGFLTSLLGDRFAFLKRFSKQIK